MSTQYRLVQSGKTASGGWSAGQGSLEPVAPRIYYYYFYYFYPQHNLHCALEKCNERKMNNNEKS
jgi:carbohydrate-binding DOMON domain-containing protein